jgi:hypothetical protein
MTSGWPPISSSWRQAPWDPRPVFFFQLNTCGYSPYVTSSLMRGWVCHLQLLLTLTSAVILRSESRGTHDHILLSQIRDSANLEGQVPIFISPRNRVVQLYRQALCSLFITSHNLQGCVRSLLHILGVNPHKTPFILVSVGMCLCHPETGGLPRICLRGNVFTEPLPRKWMSPLTSLFRKYINTEND